VTLTRRPSIFDDFFSLRRAVDRLFDETMYRQVEPEQEEARAMPLDIYADKDNVVIEAALPGVKPEDVHISVLGDRLTLAASAGTERSEENGGYMYREVRRGRLARTVTLPAGLRTDEAVASFENGMLRLSIPKAEQAKPREIPVSTTSEGAATAVPASTSEAGQSAS
jgi:HSP20 family protein